MTAKDLTGVNRDNRDDLWKTPFLKFRRRGGLSSVSLIRALFSNLNSVFSVASCSKLRLHQMKDEIRNTLIAAAAICSLLVNPAHACTGIRLIAEDVTVSHARTMEFAIDIHSDVIMVPRGYARVGTTPDGKEGLKWKAKYASIGANGVGLPILFDGLNEKGLAAGTF